MTCSRSGITKKDDTEDETGDIEVLGQTPLTTIDRMSGNMISPPMVSFTVPADEILLEFSHTIHQFKHYVTTSVEDHPVPPPERTSSVTLTVSDGVDNEDGVTESDGDDSVSHESGEHESDKDCVVIGGKPTTCS